MRAASRSPAPDAVSSPPMRVALVGPPEARARLRTHLPPSIEVAGEFATMAEARAAAAVDAIVASPDADRLADPAAGRDSGRRAAAWDLEAEPGEPEPPVETLTPREMEVLVLMAQGLTNKRIAARLAISDQTVKFHVAAISGKLGAANRTDAVRRGVRRGLLTL